MMLDEIYVSPKVAYKGGRLEGFAENSGSGSSNNCTGLYDFVYIFLSIRM